jgi:hypothetical protein
MHDEDVASWAGALGAMMVKSFRNLYYIISFRFFSYAYPITLKLTLCPVSGNLSTLTFYSIALPFFLLPPLTFPSISPSAFCSACLSPSGSTAP